MAVNNLNNLNVNNLNNLNFNNLKNDLRKSGGTLRQKENKNALSGIEILYFLVQFFLPTTSVLLILISPLIQAVACLETERNQKKRNRVQQNWMIKVRQAAMPAKKLGQKPSNKKILKYSHCHAKQFHPSSASNKAIAIFQRQSAIACLRILPHFTPREQLLASTAPPPRFHFFHQRDK